MTHSQCNILFENIVEESCSVAELIKLKAQERQPLLSWSEPDPFSVNLSNRTGRREDFNPLVHGMPSWPGDLTLVEARLFWINSALHVVAKEGGGCAWVHLEETSDGSDTRVVERHESEVLTCQDRNRFGLVNEKTIERLRAIEYRQHGRLVAWRLTIMSEERTNA